MDGKSGRGFTAGRMVRTRRLPGDSSRNGKAQRRKRNEKR